MVELISASDPLLYDHPLPLSENYYPMGFPLTITTNSEHILAAARQSWADFPKRFNTPPLQFRIGVEESSETCCPVPAVRGQSNLISFIGSAENFVAGDLNIGFGFGWLTPAVAQSCSFVRFHYLDSLTLTIIDSLYLSAIHAACVVFNGSGILLCGASGAGKSTLAYGCAKRGWGYVADDASSLLRNRTDRVVIGNPHRLRLRPDAARLFPEFQDRLASERANGKLSIEIKTAGQEQIQRVPESQIHHVVFLNRQPDTKASLAPFPKDRALDEMASVICYGSPEHRRERIDLYRNLLEVPVSLMTYSDLGSAIDCLENLVRSTPKC